MLKLAKKIIVFLIITSLLMIMTFSFATMVVHSQDNSMPVDCPLSAPGTVTCSGDSLASVFHHISAFQDFINFTINNEFAGFITLILLLLLISIKLFIDVSYVPLSALFKRDKHNALSFFSFDKIIIRWLSLFENSPSL